MTLYLTIEADGDDADELGRRMLALGPDNRIEVRIMDTELAAVRVIDVTLRAS